ncbi:hypothetical protein ACFVSX_34205, partial [Streptomyces rubiginosohelvolus]|uniref:hypothetical protein n=1 Tax=Streptomyces rubiginosohelvolus TaxID=67362 RepID=UPI0036DF2D8A
MKLARCRFLEVESVDTLEGEHHLIGISDRGDLHTGIQQRRHDGVEDRTRPVGCRVWGGVGCCGSGCVPAVGWRGVGLRVGRLGGVVVVGFWGCVVWFVGAGVFVV